MVLHIQHIQQSFVKSYSFVESPDMKNVYDGVVILDYNGEAEIELPAWFGALNKDFRYQLTAIGAPGPNLYIAEEISDGVANYSNSSSSNNKNSRFKIAGGTSGMKVSWQVTGIRQDPYAKAHPIQVEEDKPAKERGYYLYPDLYGQPEEKGISRLLFPPEEKQELFMPPKDFHLIHCQSSGDISNASVTLQTILHVVLGHVLLE
jgi:hypothetical protein